MEKNTPGENLWKKNTPGENPWKKTTCRASPATRVRPVSRTRSAHRAMQSMMLIPRGGHLPHDKDGKLLGMGHEASALSFGAQFLSTDNPERKKQFEKAMAIRLEEKRGWLAVRTEEFPAGDIEGAAKASLAIATYHLELDEMDKGLEWLSRALDEAPDNTMVKQIIIYNRDVVKTFLRSCSSSSTPSPSGRSSPVQESVSAAVPVSAAAAAASASIERDLAETVTRLAL